MNDYPITKGRCGMKAAVMFVMTLLMLLPQKTWAQTAVTAMTLTQTFSAVQADYPELIASEGGMWGIYGAIPAFNNGVQFTVSTGGEAVVIRPTSIDNPFEVSKIDVYLAEYNVEVSAYDEQLQQDFENDTPVSTSDGYKCSFSPNGLPVSSNEFVIQFVNGGNEDKTVVVKKVVLTGTANLNITFNRTDDGHIHLEYDNAYGMVKCYYSIDYVDASLTDVTDAEYNPNANTPGFTLAGPCTVTAYTQLGTAKSATRVGKLFGFAESEMSTPYLYNGTVDAPTIVPTLPNFMTVTYSNGTAVASPTNPISSTGTITINGVATASYSAAVASSDGGYDDGTWVDFLNEPYSSNNTYYYSFGSFSCEVTKRPLSECAVSLYAPSVVYNGYDRKPSTAGVVVKDVEGSSFSFPQNEYVVTGPDEVINVGEYTITISAADDSRLSGSVTKTLTITPVSLTGATVLTEPTSYIYSGVETRPTVTVTIPGEKGDIVIDAANYDVSYTNNINVGTATVTITGKGNYSGSASTTYAITKATPTVTTPPTALTLTYSGAAQELVNAGSTTGGTLEYSLDGTNYSASIPKGTDAKTYTVSYRVSGGDNYNDVAAASITVTIAKATPTVTAPTAKTLTYTGAAQELVNAGSTTGGTLEYSLDGTTYGTAIPTASAVGTYTVSYRVTGGNNYNDVAAATVTATISASQSAVATAPTANSLTYTGSAQALLTAGTATNGTMQYSTDGQSYSTTIPTGTNAGSYDVWYKVVGNTGYNDTQAVQLKVTIAKATPTLTFSKTEATAKVGENFTPPTLTTSPQGLTVVYGSSAPSVAEVNANTGEVIPKAQGTATITAAFEGNSNYKEASASYILSVSKADAKPIELSFSGDKATATYGDTSVNTPPLTNTQGVTLNWTTSDDKVATVDLDGNVTIVGAGTAIIYASFFGSDEYQSKTVSYTLTVNKATPTLTFSKTEATAKVGENFTPPTLTTSPQGLTVVYGSSAPSVAEVNANTGEVIPKAQGVATITAAFEGNANYKEAKASYTLTVAHADAKPVKISFVEDKVTVTYGDEPFDSPELALSAGITANDIEWSSSKDKVATVVKGGVVTIVGAGTATITASFPGNADYEATLASYTLTVNKATAKIAFETKSEIVVLPPSGEDEKSFTQQLKITKEAGPEKLNLVYESSDEKVAAIGADSNDDHVSVVFKAPGTVKITARYVGDQNWKEANDTCTVTVAEETTDVVNPVTKDEMYSFVASIMLNLDGTEKDLTAAVLDGRILTFLKDLLAPEGDGWDPDENCLVINTETPTETVLGLLSSDVKVGSPEWIAAFTGLVFMLPADGEEGELEIVSQEMPGSQLMVKVGDAEPVGISNPNKQLNKIFIPAAPPSPSGMGLLMRYIYMYNHHSLEHFARTRTIEKGKKTTGKIKVHSVAYKSSNGSGIQTIKQLLPIDDSKWYDLNGQRISKPTQKGIYILGHRKVVIK